MNEIIPNLYLGDFNDALQAQGMQLLCVLEQKPPNEPANATWVPILMNGKASKEQLETACIVIDAILSTGAKLLVHCAAGIERSPLTLAWYLHTRKSMTMDEAYGLLLSKRPIIQRRDFWL